MKKRIISFLCALLILTACMFCTLYYLGQRGLSITEARCAVTDNGSYLMIRENSPIVMHSKNEKHFNNIDTGDRILVFHDGVNESYPGSTGVYAVFKLGEGKVSDIPDTVLESLSELGWSVLVSEGEVRN